MTILFNCQYEKNGPEFRDMLCKQLKGNPDSINSKIIVSDVDENLIGLYVSPDFQSDPQIVIDL